MKIVIPKEKHFCTSDPKNCVYLCLFKTNLASLPLSHSRERSELTGLTTECQQIHTSTLHVQCCGQQKKKDIEI